MHEAEQVEVLDDPPLSLVVTLHVPLGQKGMAQLQEHVRNYLEDQYGLLSTDNIFVGPLADELLLTPREDRFSMHEQFYNLPEPEVDATDILANAPPAAPIPEFEDPGIDRPESADVSDQFWFGTGDKT